MAKEPFEDKPMSFGEHIEELRRHLIRAVLWLLAAFFICVFKGEWVVKIIADPVEQQLTVWYKSQLEKRAKQYGAEQNNLPSEQQKHFEIEAQLEPDELAKLAAVIAPDRPAPAEPLTLKLNYPVAPIVQAVLFDIAILEGKTRMKVLAAQEGFVIYFKCVLGAALILASPFIFREIYAFIAVGLYAHERRFVNLTLPFSIFLFLSGVAVCYFLVFPAMLSFFLGANEWMDLEPDFRLNEWVGFAVILMLIFGAVFQMPLLMLMLERVGIISYEFLVGKRRIAIFVNAFIAALITPGGDPNTMILLALPMCILYEIGLLLMRYFRRSNPFAVDTDASENGEEVADLFVPRSDS